MDSFHSISLVLYFILNLFVTFTNKKILGSSSTTNPQRPYLLTAAHGIASFVGCVAVKIVTSRSRNAASNSGVRLRESYVIVSRHQGAFLAIFSLFYTINIALSNMSLAMVSLPLNQTVRATAPILTVVLSVLVLGRSLHTYSVSACISLLFISAGVVIAASSVPGSGNIHGRLDVVGILITLLSALTAVLKTIITHKLMTSLSLRLSSIELLRVLSPYASVQAFGFAYYTGELGSLNLRMLPNLPFSMRNTHNQIDVPAQAHGSLLTAMNNTTPHRAIRNDTLLLWLANAVAAFLLNISSFEANKTCGPVSMAVAANLKQIVILLAPYLALVGGMSTSVINAEEITENVILGTLLTVIGGIWYAWEMARSKKQ